MSGNAHRDKYFADQYPDGSWFVNDRIGVALYDPMEDGEGMTEQEARDLAWAWNNGADDDDHAINMIIRRDGGVRPDWLGASW